MRYFALFVVIMSLLVFSVVNTSASADFQAGNPNLEFVFVPSGCFMMGDQFNDGDVDEKPAHQVCVDSFLIGKYEVTQGQWQQVMGNNPSYFKSGDNYPVEGVSWSDAQEFMRQLGKLTGKTYRLPTEAEWEYAARSGGKAEKYAGGNVAESVSWNISNSEGKTHPVGQKSPNGLGVYDMSGNVWEWTQDYYDSRYYEVSPKQNPGGSSGPSYRVPRGGSWCLEARDSRSTNRLRFHPSNRDDDLGFRVLMESEITVE